MSLLILVALLLRVKMSCSNDKGIYIMKVKIHLDQITHNKISAYESFGSSVSKGSRERVIGYLDNILNEVNQEISQYDVQLEGDYTRLVFEELDLPIVKDTLCVGEYIPTLLSTQVIHRLEYPRTDGLGLRIIGFSCLIFPPQKETFKLAKSHSCGTLATIFVLEPYTFKFILKRVLKIIITNGIGTLFSPDSHLFARAICKYANTCVTGNPVLGELRKQITRMTNKHEFA